MSMMELVSYKVCISSLVQLSTLNSEPYTVADISAGTLDKTILVSSQPQSSVSLCDMRLKTEPINEDVYAQPSASICIAKVKTESIDDEDVHVGTDATEHVIVQVW